MSYDLCVFRGSPRHFAGRLERLKSLDEAAVRDVLRTPPPGIEVHVDGADGFLWAGEAVIAQVSLYRDASGTLRTVEAGLASTGDGDYDAEFAAIATRLLGLADRVGGRLYREPFDRSGRLERDEIERIAARAPAPPPAARSEPPPRLLVDFYDLSDEDASAYLERHVARAPERLAAFPREVAALGGPAEAKLDTTAESLVRLGGWLARTLPGRYAGLREPTEQERTFGGGVVQLTPPEWRRQSPDEPGTLPPWCAPGAEQARSPLPPAALWLADGLGYYLAECLARELGEVRWQVYRAASRRLRDVDENAPVVATSRGTFNAHSAAYGIVLTTVAYRRDDPELPTRIYTHALERLRDDEGASVGADR